MYFIKTSSNFAMQLYRRTLFFERAVSIENYATQIITTKKYNFRKIQKKNT